MVPSGHILDKSMLFSYKVYFDQIIASNKEKRKYNTIWTVTRVVGYKSSHEFVQ